jgi:hypothetical protein
VNKVGPRLILLFILPMVIMSATSSEALAAGASWSKWEKTFLFPVDNKFTADMNTIQSHLTNGSCTAAEAKNVHVDALLWDSIINSPSRVVNSQVATVARDATTFASDATRICSPTWYPNATQAAAFRVAYNTARAVTNRLATVIVEYS